MSLVRAGYRVGLGAVAVACIMGLGAVQSSSRSLGVLPFESGRVEYRFTKPGLTGTSEFSWIRRGAAFRQDLRYRTTLDTVIGRGRDLFMLNPLTRTAQRAEVQGTDLWLNEAEMPYVTPGAGAGEVVGSGTVLGKPCEIRKLYTTRVWYWEGLPLKMERPASAQMRPLSLVAVRLEDHQAAPSSQFELPTGYRVSDFPRKDPPFPWNRVATAALIGMLFLVGIGSWAVETAFSRQRRLPQDA